jgi:nitroimidazol reductase NimA-like FMN-containing flavoprotein (pyridoxamine 5'-phosphate oxidase superfamily)
MEQRLDRVNRHPERARHDRADLYAVLDAEHPVGTLSTVVDGKPWVVPMLYGRDGDRILLHGSVAAGALRHVAAGAAAAFSVTHIDGWVYAHTLFDSSANYRSAVVHGTLVPLKGDEAAAALTRLTEAMTPGRWREVPEHTRRHLAATEAIALDIVDGQWTVKIRDGGPKPPPESDDVDPELWTGVLPIRSAYGEPVTSAHLPADLPVSPSVLALIESYEQST